MICRPCRRGGAYTWAAADLPPDDPERRALIAKARRKHRRCRGGTWCDCRHRVAA